ncbi:mitochondrial import inner membrane translocase, subunit Tim17/22 [Sporormia fimetaria CBS 119925]|uniref:Mitochondrial import inner membrane translocase subunit TIM22 n=1 Tax=Sporormia fimetaria CBS 119925 TaxID=1340428 RepID=A0A6A6V7L5_9PLEO|nr:mitochondrial import inner membrane translocase, subunit Tim17/22 [Sporormia fimetaria CBS 119925]
MGMESCLGKTVMAGVMGGGLGAMFGLFMASMRYDTPMSQPLPVNAAPGAAKPITASTAPSTTGTAAATATAKPSSITSALPHPPTSVPLTDLPLKQQLKHGLRDMYNSAKSSGKNFAVIGSMFSGTECAIEGLRAKNDIWNGVYGGCLTGGILARNAGPQAVVVGCAGFAAFSAAIDAYMRLPEDERSRPIA